MQKVMMIDPKEEDYMYNEAIKTFRTNMQFVGKNIKSILLTSCVTGEGKSDLTFELAKGLGNIGKKVLLLDADIRGSAFITRYQVEQSTFGLSQYLSGQVELEDICYQTNFPNMDIIFAGSYGVNSSDLLEEEAFEELMKTMRERYDYIIVDTPPIGTLIDAAIIAEHCDGAVMVIESEETSYKSAQKAKKQLEQTNCKLLGCVLNKVDLKKDKYYGSYGYGYHYYGHSREQEMKENEK